MMALDRRRVTGSDSGQSEQANANASEDWAGMTRFSAATLELEDEVGPMLAPVLRHDASSTKHGTPLCNQLRA